VADYKIGTPSRLRRLAVKDKVIVGIAEQNTEFEGFWMRMTRKRVSVCGASGRAGAR